MKLFKGHFFLGLIMTALCVAGCSNDDFQEAQNPEVITITADAPNQEATRVNFGKENFVISWKAGDAFQVYSNGAAGNKFDFESKDAQGRGQFKGTKPSTSGNMFAYYPATKSQNTGRDNDLFDYTGQVQAGNDNVDGLSDYLYMLGDVDPVDYSVSNFVLQPAILKMTINMPADFEGAVSSVAIDFANTKFHKRKHVQASLDVEADDGLSMSMSLTDVSLTTGEQLVVYMAMSPMQVTDDTFTLTVTAGGVQYVSTIENFTYDFVQAKVCPAVLTVVKQENVMTIAEVRAAYAERTLEYPVTVTGVVTAGINSKTYIQDDTSALLLDGKTLPSDIYEGDNVVVELSGISVGGGRMKAKAATFELNATGTFALNSLVQEKTVAEINQIGISNSSPNVPVYVVIRGATLPDGIGSSKYINQASETIQMYTPSYSGDVPVGACDVYGVIYSFNSVARIIVTDVVAGEAVPFMSFTVDPVDNILSEGQNVTVAVKSNVSWKVVLKQGEAEISSQEGSNSQDVTVAIPANASITESASYTVELICLDAETTLAADPVALTQLKAGEEPASNEVSLLDFHATVAGWSLPKSDVSDVVIRGVVVYQESNKIFFSDKTAGFCCYKYGQFKDYAIGDVCVVTPSVVGHYHGFVQATSGTFERIVDETKDETTVLVDATIAEIKNAADKHYQGMYVRLTGVVPSATNWDTGTTLSKDGVSLSTYKNADSLTPLNTKECVLDVLCVVDYYDGYRLKVMSVEHVEEPAYINLSADIFSAIAIDGSEDPTITVQSNVTWTAQISGEGADILYDENSILVDLPANTTGADKTYTVTVTSTKDASLVKTIDLIQSGPYINDLTADRATGIAADGSFEPTITVDANVEWTAEATNGATLLSDVQGGEILVTLPENTASQEVTYTVTVSSVDGSIVKSIDLVQVAAGTQTLGELEGFPIVWNFGSDGFSNTDWFGAGANKWYAYEGNTGAYLSQFGMSSGSTTAGYPYVKALNDSGDYFLFTIPVKNLPEGAGLKISCRIDPSNSTPDGYSFDCYTGDEPPVLNPTNPSDPSEVDIYLSSGSDKIVNEQDMGISTPEIIDGILYVRMYVDRYGDKAKGTGASSSGGTFRFENSITIDIIEK